MKNLIVIQCVKNKQTYPCKVEEMYNKSPYFRKLLDISKQLQSQIGGDIKVLSGMYGLMDLDRVIEPYDYGMVSSGPVEDKLKKEGKLDPQVIKSIGQHRRLKNKIINQRLTILLNNQGILDKHYNMVYSMISEHYIPAFEQSNVISKPYKMLTLGSGGQFKLTNSDFLDKQLKNLDDVFLGYYKEGRKYIKQLNEDKNN